MSDILYIWQQFFGLFSGFWTLIITFCSGIIVAILILKLVLYVIQSVYNNKEN